MLERTWQVLRDTDPPIRFTHRGLACLVFERLYPTQQPTRSQLSAIRRATAALVNDGRIERSSDRSYGEKAYDGPPRPTHLRAGRWYRNPEGVSYRRIDHNADNTGLSDRQIATVLGVSVRTVRRDVERAK